MASHASPQTVATEANGGPSEAAPSATEQPAVDAAIFYLKRSICLGVISTTVYLGCFIAMLVMYQDNWMRKCDNEYKMWSIGWAVLRCLRSSVMLSNLSTKLRDVQRTHEVRPEQLFYKHPVFELLTFGWFIFGMFINFNDALRPDICKGASYVWSMVGWVHLLILYFYPCFLIIILAPFVMLFIRFRFIRERLIPVLFGPQAHLSQEKIEDELLEKMHVEKYQHLSEQKLITPLSGLENASAAGANGSASEKPATGAQSANAAADAAGDLSRGDTQEGGEDAAKAKETSKTQSGADTVITISSDSCPICCCDFEMEDPVLQLPCNPKLHYFHDRCIKEWFAKSVYCPMCRTNIRDLIKAEVTA